MRIETWCPVPAPERTHVPPCCTRSGVLWLPPAVGQRWAQVPVREYAGLGWRRPVEGPIPVGLPEVASLHQADLGSPDFARGFVVVT